MIKVTLIGGELKTMNWLRKIFKQEDVYDETSKLPNAINLKEEFKAERNSQKENSWVKIHTLIEDAMKEGKGYVEIHSDTYKNIPLKELLHEIKKAKYKLKDNTCGSWVKYCYNMGYSLFICWEW